MYKFAPHPAFIRDCLYELKKRVGITDNGERTLETMVKDIIAFHLADENEYYYEDGVSADAQVTGLDTYPRDILMDEFASMMTGMRWPCFGDDEEFKERFLAALTREIVKRKFDLVE